MCETEVQVAVVQRCICSSYGISHFPNVAIGGGYSAVNGKRRCKGFRPGLMWQSLRRSKHSSFNTPVVTLHVLRRAQGKSLRQEQHRSHVMMMQWCCLDADGACFSFLGLLDPYCKEHSNSPWNQELRNVVLHDFAGQMLQSVLTSTLLGPGQSDSLAVLRSPEDFAAQFGSRSLENAADASELASAGFTGFGRQPLWFVTGSDTE